MERQILIAGADGSLSDLYQKYFAAYGYFVRVVSGGVECLRALRETPPDVLVLDTELKWGGADGVLAVMDEEDRLSTIPVVLLNDTEVRGPEASVRLRPSTIPVVLLNNDTDGKDADDSVPLAWPSMPADATPLLMRPGEGIPFLWPSVPKRDATILKCPDQNSIPSLGGSPIKRPRAAHVVDRLLKPFRFQNLLDSIVTSTARPAQPRYTSAGGP